MQCTIQCLQGGQCSFNNTCICPPCFTGARCEISCNIIKLSLTSAIQWDIHALDNDLNFNVLQFLYTFVIAAMLAMALFNNIACLQTFLQHNIRSTNCGMLQIFYCITGLITIIGMQLRMLTMLKFDELSQAYAYRYAACNIIPVAVILLGDNCMWLSATLAIEFVLLESFNFNIYRSRRFSVISSLIGLILTIGSHLHEIIARRPSPHPTRPDLYTCIFAYALPLDIIDKILRVCHVIIPLSIHFISSILMLISITRRTQLVRNRNDIFRVFLEKCIERKHFFVPPFMIILSNLPHLILHLKDQCEDARDTTILRTHIAFNILVYLPPSITFFIYIYPSKSYMHQFKKTFMGRWLTYLLRCKKIKQSNNTSIQSKALSNETVFSSVSS